jgi:hypothetical protein
MFCLKPLLSDCSITYLGGLKNLQGTLCLVIWPSLEFLLCNIISNTYCCNNFLVVSNLVVFYWNAEHVRLYVWVGGSLREWADTLNFLILFECFLLQSLRESVSREINRKLKMSMAWYFDKTQQIFTCFR